MVNLLCLNRNWFLEREEERGYEEGGEEEDEKITRLFL